LSTTSVVVAAFSGEEALARCLESLEGQGDGLERIAVTDAGSDAVGRLSARFPGVIFLEAPAGTSVFRLRSLGVGRAGGERIALIEDHCTAAPGWLRRLRAAHDGGSTVVGGPVDNGLDGTYAWALYLCEYGVLLPPLADGPVPTLSGVNVSYARPALLGCRSTWADEFRENEVHDALRAAGHSLSLAGAACVRSHLRMPLGEAIGHLFRGGRHFGRYRRGRATPLVRILLPLASPLVPFVLLARLAGAVIRRRPRRLTTLLLGLPWVLCLLGAWSGGEAAGYLSTSAGPVPPRPGD
jgi:glycosyl transferase family 2